MVQTHVPQPCRRSVESDASRWYREEASANLDGGSILAPVAQCRGARLKPGSVSVRVRPGVVLSV
jgi:hypothetical protein